MGWWLIAALVGCGSSDKLLQDLNGSWAGPATVNGAIYNTYATFTYSEYLDGDVLVQDPLGDRLLSVLKAESFGTGDIAIDLSNAAGEALDLDGTMGENGNFTGTITYSVPCATATACGWTGTFDLAPAQPFINPGGTGGDTGIRPTDTGPGPTDTWDTGGLTDTGPGTGDTGPGPTDTGPGTGDTGP